VSREDQSDDAEVIDVVDEDGEEMTPPATAKQVAAVKAAAQEGRLERTRLPQAAGRVRGRAARRPRRRAGARHRAPSAGWRAAGRRVMAVNQKGWHGWALERWGGRQDRRPAPAAIHVGHHTAAQAGCRLCERGNRVVAIAYFKQEHER